VERQCESGNQEHCVLRIQNEHINIDDKHKDKESTTTTMSASNKKNNNSSSSSSMIYSRHHGQEIQAESFVQFPTCGDLDRNS
jgi:hypothetical protein